jgi:hypothetical protein
MRRIIAITAVLALGLEACTLKYDVLRGTSLPNPPTALVKIYIREFQVVSKASVVDPVAAAGGATEGGGRMISGLAEQAGNKLIEISRPSRIEDLSGAIIRELRKNQIQVFSQTEMVRDLQTVRLVDNPFEVVSSDADAQLEISGTAQINSQRIGKVFSQDTKNIEVALTVKDLHDGSTSRKNPLRVGVKMIFNSKELEEAMAVAVVTSLAQKILF